MMLPPRNEITGGPQSGLCWKNQIKKLEMVNSREHNSGGSIFVSRGGSIPVSGEGRYQKERTKMGLVVNKLVPAGVVVRDVPPLDTKGYNVMDKIR